jgi:predicted metal-dependent enzyme (double-stranded beta helix superfamily)
VVYSCQQSAAEEHLVRVAEYTLDQFVAEVRAVRAQKLGAPRNVEALTPLLERIVSRPDCLTDHGHPRSPEKDFNIYVDDTLTVRTVVWKPGETTPVHNHLGWAIIGVVEGNERNTNYRRVDDGFRPWRVKLEQVGVADIRPGQSSFILAPDDIHTVTIPEAKTVAIHLYGNDLSKQWRYQFDLETGEVRPFRGRNQQ